MAKGKKSFIFYSNWRDTFEAIPPEKGYELLMHILKYVNDENPETECVMVNALFQSFKSTLKADLEKWEGQRKQRSEAGKKSAESRKRKSTSVNERQRNSTVNVNDNVINNTNNNKKIIPKGISKKEIFETWLAYRKEIKKPITNGRTLQSLADRFDKENLEVCKFVVNLSIENNYQGLFWERCRAKPKINNKKGAGRVL